MSVGPQQTNTVEYKITNILLLYLSYRQAADNPKIKIKYIDLSQKIEKNSTYQLMEAIFQKVLEFYEIL